MTKLPTGDIALRQQLPNRPGFTAQLQLNVQMFSTVKMTKTVLGKHSHETHIVLLHVCSLDRTQGATVLLKFCDRLTVLQVATFRLQVIALVDECCGKKAGG